MDDALLVRRLQRRGNLLGRLQRRVQRHRSRLETIRQRRPFDQLQHQGADRAGLLEPMDDADVRVVQGGQRPGFALEPRHAIRIVHEVRRQNLQRDLAPELCVARAIHLTHAARAERREDFVRTDTDAGL